MANIKYIVSGLVLTLVILSIYVAWQNRASDKVITSFITIALVGAAGTLVATLYSIKTENLTATIYKTYIFNKITKRPLQNSSLPFLRTFSGKELEFDTSYLVQEATNKIPFLATFKGEYSDSKAIKQGNDLYNDILFYQVVYVLSSRSDPSAQATRFEGVNGVEITTIPNTSKIHTKTIKLDEIKKWNPGNICFSLNDIKVKELTIPRNANISGNNHSITIKNNFVDLSIEITSEGGSGGVGKLAPLLEMSSGQSMKYWAQRYKIKINVDYNALRSGHPLMREYRKWIEALIQEFKFQFDTQLHWQKAQEEFLLYKNLHIETAEEALQSRDEYHKYIEEKISENNSLNSKKKTEQIIKQ